MAIGENSSKGHIRLTPELFSINHLQHYVETRYGFLQDLSPAQAEKTLEKTPFEMPESEKDLGESLRREIKDHRAYLATASMEMVHGNYRQALDALEQAECGYRKYFARDHTSRLEISSFRALLLVLNSKPVEAEGLCKTTLSILSEEKGYAHPLTLVTMSIMVQIQLNLWRSLPALDTATTLVRRTTEILGDSDILTLHSRTLLAAARFHRGEYCASEAEFELIIPILERSLKSNHPDMFQHQCFLAKVYLKRGKFDTATKLLVPVLEAKLQEYAKNSKLNKANLKAGDSRVPEYGLSDFLRTFVKDPKAAFLGKKPHPQFLKALSVYADVLYQQQSSADFAISIHKAVWSQEKAELGDSHLDTVATLNRLAIITRDNEENVGNYIRVRGQLEDVIRARGEVLGGSHIITLCAQRETLILGYRIKSLVNPGPWAENEENDPVYFQGKDVYAMSQRIYDSHKSHLGRFHPETIQSLHWLFKLRVSKSFHEQSTAVTGELIQCLRVMRKESPIFSLSLEISAAYSFYEFNYYRTALQISMKTLQAIDHSLATNSQDMRFPLERLRTENLGFINHLKDKLEEVRT
ncbi:uncharacterized protein GGS22DRAFT_199237 [Annulohypoxylon maeteangense]|uniref:uncharacterized protein n=1 Tax=Annulohypoxylon maeteangense TaxID=1927788 RepID=UPI002008C200|nr:uncharacterized protein GGS22DRAFT_199237 [Annulohypoxylon maeteangense]KAI0886914.1 hypothetical protein GGS22DRAFT_199237 [Annulohypoxylon maeteangense]